MWSYFYKFFRKLADVFAWQIFLIFFFPFFEINEKSLKSNHLRQIFLTVKLLNYFFFDFSTVLFLWSRYRTGIRCNFPNNIFFFEIIFFWIFQLFWFLESIGSRFSGPLSVVGEHWLIVSLCIGNWSYTFRLESQNPGSNQKR